MTLDTLFQQIIDIINYDLVPLIFALAFLVFLWGIFQYLIAGAANQEKRTQGQQLIIWSVIGFFLMLSIWGIVHLFTGTFGFDTQTTPNLPTFDSTSH